METALTPSEGAPSIGSADKGADASSNNVVFEDSRSETSTIDTDSEESADVSGLTFFTRLYEIPVVNDAVTSVYRIAESNRYTGAIITYAEKVGGLAEKTRPLLKPVEGSIVALDGYATRSLEFIEARYPVVTKPTNEVLESVQTQAKAVEERYPVIARTFAVAKNTANTALDRVDYLVDYILPPGMEPEADDNQPASDEPSEDKSQAEKAQQVDSPLGKVTILVHKVPRRLGTYYYKQMQASKTAVGGIKQTATDTARVYSSEISSRSQQLLGVVQDHVSTTVNTTIPAYLPQFAQQYYTQGKDLLVTKAAKLHAEYSRSDCDARTKVFNLILISGEQIPVLENITARIFGKGMESSPVAPAASSPGTADEKTPSLAQPSIKSADMSDEMQVAILEIAKAAYEKSQLEKDIAREIKLACDEKFGKSWHVIVGRNFGSYVTHEVGHFIYFYNKHLAHLVFKSG
ncbi:hypothetical protein GGH12_000002 [Coemansia sp. RSA 1822]|nr:hypothetical protein GGH12_000002 [Coemansia sp. RSA 1822]